MASETSNPAARANARTGLGWDSLAASDREPTLNLHLLQTHHVASRFGLSADRARLVAALAFTGVPR